jgi:hypothetical protein
MRFIFAAVLLVGMLAGCQSARKRSLAPRLEPSIGTQVTLVGVAEPRKGGAALKGEDFYVWLKDVDFWPEAVVMKKVEVKGRLEEDHGLPVFIYKPGDPMIPQGIPVPAGTDLKEESRRLVLVHPTWRLIE